MRKIHKISRLFLIPAALFLVLLASACNLPDSQPAPEPTDTLADAVEPTSEAAQPTSEVMEPTPESIQQDGLSVRIDVSGVAGDFHYEVVPAVLPGSGGPIWDEMPEHVVITLDGYPVSEHLMQPQVFIYPVEGLKASEIIANRVSDLESLLQSQQPGQNLPYLPLYNAGQVMHAQVKFFDFQSGSGVRYLTQFDQAYLPINNGELLYTYQGLTSDGNYYIAVVMPVNMPGLPDNANVDDSLPPEFFNDFPQYLSNMVNALNQQGDSGFTPDLSALDAMVQSIEVN